jgi:hypothetical protein
MRASRNGSVSSLVAGVISMLSRNGPALHHASGLSAAPLRTAPLRLSFLMHMKQLFLSVLGLSFGQEAFCQTAEPPAPNAALLALEKQVLYHPRKYDPAVMKKFTDRGGKRLDYQTAQGAQSAWLIPAAKNDVSGKLWLICGGNGTLAMEMEALCRGLPFPNDTFLLVDYPGYGECKGEPSPVSIRENLKSAVLLAAKHLSIEPAQIPQRVCTFGHSLGCAAALLAVDEFKLQAAVLCAPFTSTMEMARDKFNLPLDFPLQHKFDNRTGMNVLSKNGGHAWIFHGDADNVIPVAMSQTLAKEFKDIVNLTIVPSGRHADILRIAATGLVQAMTDARKIIPPQKR